MDQRKSIRAIRNRTLVKIGANDPATTPEAGRAIHDAIPGVGFEYPTSSTEMTASSK